MNGDAETATVGGVAVLRDAPAAAVGDALTALERGREHLLALQDEGGWWKGELQTNVTMDAEDILLREFLGVRQAVATERSAAWIRSEQREDGSWSNFYGGPGELSTTIEAYVALRLAGDDPAAAHMRAAASFARDAGGLEHARVFTHIWLALFGAWPWEHVPELPPELMLLPSRAPLSIYDFACWARQTVVALSIVLAVRPTRSLPFTLDELHGSGEWRRPRGRSASARALGVVDRVLALYRRNAVPALREAALARAERWIVRRQEADGSWGGIQPPWVYSLIALHLRGYPIEHPVMKAGLDGLERFTVDEEPSRRLEACQSPVWDTALAIIALADAGMPTDHPALVRAADWLMDEQVLADRGLGGAPSVARTRRLVIRVRQRLLPRRRRHGRGRAGALRVSHPDPDRVAQTIARARRLAGGDAGLGRRLGRVRRREHQANPARPAVLRLRRGHRSPERGRHARTRWRCSPRSGAPTPTQAAAGSHG